MEIKQSKFDKLDILHHLTAGFKAYITEYTHLAIDALRQSCGGAGFHMASGIAYTWLNNAPAPTYEGVNVVLYQQASRLIIK